MGDSSPRPADYESAALPTELIQLKEDIPFICIKVSEFVKAFSVKKDLKIHTKVYLSTRKENYGQ